MNRNLIQTAIDEAREQEANLMICDRRDTFTVEADELSEIELNDESIRVKMEDGKATVYVEYKSIYKLVVEKERKGGRSGARAGFGAASN